MIGSLLLLYNYYVWLWSFSFTFQPCMNVWHVTVAFCYCLLLFVFVCFCLFLFFLVFVFFAPQVHADVNNNIMYSLFAVAVHEGSTSRGHHYAYVKSRCSMPLYSAAANQRSDYRPTPTSSVDETSPAPRPRVPLPPPPGQWLYCSDTVVMPVSEEEVLRSQAYLLFYERLPLTQ